MYVLHKQLYLEITEFSLIHFRFLCVLSARWIVLLFLEMKYLMHPASAPLFVWAFAYKCDSTLNNEQIMLAFYKINIQYNQPVFHNFI